MSSSTGKNNAKNKRRRKNSKARRDHEIREAAKNQVEYQKFLVRWTTISTLGKFLIAGVVIVLAFKFLSDGVVRSVEAAAGENTSFEVGGTLAFLVDKGPCILLNLTLAGTWGVRERVLKGRIRAEAEQKAELEKAVDPDRSTSS